MLINIKTVPNLYIEDLIQEYPFLDSFFATNNVDFAGKGNISLATYFDQIGRASCRERV